VNGGKSMRTGWVVDCCIVGHLSYCGSNRAAKSGQTGLSNTFS